MIPARVLTTRMTPRRAAAWIGGALLMAAWLASAAGSVWQTSDMPESPRPVETSGTESLAADVQAQAARLKERLATAPAPQQPSRNPFAFAPRATPRPSREAAAIERPVLEPVPEPVLSEPPLALIGIAEDRVAEGVARTAIISAEPDELFMVRAGEILGGRYRVAAVGSDSVELTDLVTGALRRLALR